MPSVWQRHPKYTLLLAFTIFATIFLLSPYGSVPTPGLSVASVGDPELASKLERSNKIYDKMLKDRAGLVKKWGPDPKDIHAFPPDVAPWPAYTAWDFFPAAYNCPHEIERHGALGDGGKWVCGLSRLREKRDCIIYSFGVNYESSFERSILSNTKHCQVFGFDFSVTSFGPEIPLKDRHRTHFFAYGLGGEDTHSPTDDPPMYTLETLMQLNGHTHIDLLKIDIEGWEFPALESFMKPYLPGAGSRASGPLPIGQLLLELHIWDRTFESVFNWWQMLESVGLRPFWTEPNLVYQNYHHQDNANLAEYSFLNVYGANAFTSDLKLE